jgi:hypothetical protein
MEKKNKIAHTWDRTHTLRSRLTLVRNTAVNIHYLSVMTTLFFLTFSAVLQTRLLPVCFYKASVISTTVTVIVFSNFILFAQMDYISLRLHNNAILTFRYKKLQD